jgi:hypothetical protein
MSQLNPDLEKKTLETQLCMAVLIASGTLKPEATWEEQDAYYDTIGACDQCELAPKCMACIICE